MQTQPTVAKTSSGLPRVRLDETLMTIMLLNELPIIAVTANLLDDEAVRADSNFCHIVRIDDEWVEA